MGVATAIAATICAIPYALQASGLSFVNGPWFANGWLTCSPARTLSLSAYGVNAGTFQEFQMGCLISLVWAALCLSLAAFILNRVWQDKPVVITPGSIRARLRDASAAVQENHALKQEGAQLWAILAAVLAELGGEVIVSGTTLELVGTDFQTLEYATEDGPEPGTTLVRLIKGGQPFTRPDDEPKQHEPELTISKIKEPDDAVRP